MLGTDHTHTQWAMGNLALHYSRRRKYQKTEELQLRIVEAKKKSFGETHELTLRSLGDLAVTYVDLDRLESAMKLQVQVLDGFRKGLGRRHPLTLTSMQHLAITYARQRNWDYFRALQSEVTQVRWEVLGRTHYDTRESLAILAWFNRYIVESKIPNLKSPVEVDGYGETGPEASSTSEAIPAEAATQDGAVPGLMPKTQFKSCPPPSTIFTGRADILTQMENYFMDDPQSNMRHVFVLHGLGGSGKTQIALKFVQKHREVFWGVFYIDASSTGSISASLKAIALVAGAGSTMDDALAWLVGQENKWLMVFDNADDTSLNLRQYFPDCSHGDILITTRNWHMHNLAGKTRLGVKAECQVSGMQQEDAKELLLSVSNMASNDTTDNCGATLVKELGYLALAIIQAGAHIRVTGYTLGQYVEMYRSNKLVLEEYCKFVPKFDGYNRTVYTTWRISYDQLQDWVAETLRILCFLDCEGITSEAMSQNVCKHLLTYQPEPMPTDGDLAIKGGVGDSLKSSLHTASGTFYKPAFLDFVRELRSHSFIDFNPSNGTYSVHPLLRDWVRRITVDGANPSYS
ncbi:hypothetical protein FRC07_003570 [Ceratobasidium sp. 392]|nr:hypothetical protein FRC07_003570 [Ceratobasidium sp. 392]